QRAFDVKRSDLEVASGRAAVVIASAGVVGAGADRVTGENAQGRWVRGGVIAVENARLKVERARFARRRRRWSGQLDGYGTILAAAPATAAAHPAFARKSTAACRRRERACGVSIPQ